MSSRKSRRPIEGRLLALSVLMAVAGAGCGGGGGGGSGSTSSGLVLTSQSLSQALADFQANGTGNPDASLLVTGALSGTLTKLSLKRGGVAKTDAAANADVATDHGGYSFRADASGNFSFNLPASVYNITIALPGYRTVTYRGVPVIKDKTTALGLAKTLEPLDVSDTDPIDPSRPVQKTYVGSARCRACHNQVFPDRSGGSIPALYEPFLATKHAHPIRTINDPVDAAAGFGVVADFSPDAGSNVRTLSFTDAATGSAAVQIRLAKSGDNRYFVTLVDRSGGVEHKYEALRTHGGTGDWKQRFQTRIGGDWYTLPIQWNEKETDSAKRWVKYNISDWFEPNGNVRQRLASRAGQTVQIFGPTQANSYERKCLGCHATVQGVRRIDAAASAAGEGDVGDYAADASSEVVGCENCHGPGSAHVASQVADDIINPSKSARRANKLPYDRAVEVCGQCHIRGQARFIAPAAAGVSETETDRTLEYPWTAANKPYRIGQDLLTTAYDVTGTAKYWNPKFTRNNHSFQHHQQWLDLQRSAHSFEHAQVACWDCHDPHKAGDNRHQLIANPDDNSLCLQCHGKDADAKTRFLLPGETSPDASVRLVTDHTKHSYNPSGAGGAVSSRCIACHMNKTASSALRYDITDHTMRIVKPVESLDMLDNGGDKAAGLVIPNSCASSTVGCHSAANSPGGNFFVGMGDTRGDATARAKLVAAVNAYESKFGSRKSTGTDVAGQLGSLEGTVDLGGVPLDGVRVMTDRGEDYDETAEDGKFRLTIPKGTYNLFAVHPSFKTTSLEAVTVSAGGVNGNLRLSLNALATGETQYVGAQKCKTCHADKYEGWQKTLHNRGIRYLDAHDDRDPRFSDVVANFGAPGAGVTFTNTSFDFGALGANRTVRLLTDGTSYTVTLADSAGDHVYPVFRTYGGGRGDWKQRFTTKIGKSTFILPVQWSEFGPPVSLLAPQVPQPRWRSYNLSNWLDPNDANRFRVPVKNESFEYQCAACHATGFQAQYRAADDEVVVKFSEMNTGCENCHGPGGAHYRTGDPTKIINPDKIASARRKLDVCGHCHGRGESTVAPDGAKGSEYGVKSRTENPAGVFQLATWSVIEATLPGPVSAVFGPYYATLVSQNELNAGDDRYWRSITYVQTASGASADFVAVPSQPLQMIRHHGQANDFTRAAHLGVGVTCWSCHDPHGSNNKANLILPDGNLIVNSQLNEAGSLCLSCHGPSGIASNRFTSVATLRTHIQGNVPRQHGSAANEAKFSCTACHMARTAQTVEKYDIHSHTFKPIDPQVSLNTALAGGGDSRLAAGANGNYKDPTRNGVWNYDRDAVMPNACSGCHTERLDDLDSLKLGVQFFKNWKNAGGGSVQ